MVFLFRIKTSFNVRKLKISKFPRMALGENRTKRNNYPTPQHSTTVLITFDSWVQAQERPLTIWKPSLRQEALPPRVRLPGPSFPPKGRGSACSAPGDTPPRPPPPPPSQPRVSPNRRQFGTPSRQLLSSPWCGPRFPCWTLRARSKKWYRTMKSVEKREKEWNYCVRREKWKKRETKKMKLWKSNWKKKKSENKKQVVYEKQKGNPRKYSKPLYIRQKNPILFPSTTMVPKGEYTFKSFTSMKKKKTGNTIDLRVLDL